MIPHGLQDLFLGMFPGKIQGTFNQGQVGICLREITQKPFSLKIDILTEEP